MASKGEAWFPFYVADYLRDTMRLTTEEHGAYMLLILACWTDGGRVADDPRELASITKLSAFSWKKIADKLRNYFTVSDGFWTHGRVVAELAKAKKISEIRAEAGAKGGRPQADNPAFAKAKAKQNETPSPLPLTPPSEDSRANALVAESVADDAGKVVNLFGEQDGQAAEDEAPKARAYPAEFEAAWRAYPHSKGRSSKVASEAAWRRLDKPTRAALPAAVARYAADGREPKADCGAPAMERWLKAARFADWMTGGGASAPGAPSKPFPGPAALRAALVDHMGEPWARVWLDPCGWQDRPAGIICRGATAATELRREAFLVLQGHGVQILTQRVQA